MRICRTKGDIHIATRSLSLEQQLEAAKMQIRGRDETIETLRAEIDRLATEVVSLQRQIAKSGKTSDSVDEPFTPTLITGTGFLGRTCKYDRVLNEISTRIAPHCPAGTVELPIGKWDEQGQEPADEVNAALQRAFVQRGFRTVSDTGCVIIEVYRLVPCHTAFLRIAAKHSGEVIWKGEIHMPFSFFFL